MREHDTPSDLFVLKRGMLTSYFLLSDGNRQILRFLFPSDLVATATLLHVKSTDTVAALTDSIVAPIDRGILATTIATHPRLAALRIAVAQSTQQPLSDRLSALGRTSAKARIAALLLEIRDGLRRADPAVADAFALMVTQKEIGDAIGLTAVHVNRMLRQLEEDGLIVREAGRVRLLDERALITIADYVDRRAGIDLNWIPAFNSGA